MRHRFRDDYGRWGMDLIDAGDRRPGQNRVGSEAAIGLDYLRIVAAARTAIQAGNCSVDNPPARPRNPCGTPPAPPPG
jgi:hypothetical protein